MRAGGSPRRLLSSGRSVKIPPIFALLRRSKNFWRKQVFREFRVWTQERGDTIAGKTHRIAGVDVMSVHETNKVSTTAPVQIIGSEQMLKLGMLNMSDALKNMAGITIRDYGGAGGMKTVSAYLNIT